jgi:MOSC domain-containing protein YiiM
MKIVSMNVGVPRKIQWRDREVVTSIFKSPVMGPVMVYRLNLEGDRQSDLEMVTQPRIPSYKLGLRLGRMDIVKRFLASNRSGVYFSVMKEGDVAIGDTVGRIKEDGERISVMEINRAVANGGEDPLFLHRAAQHPVLPTGLREHFLAQSASTERT